MASDPLSIPKHKNFAVACEKQENNMNMNDMNDKNKNNE